MFFDGDRIDYMRQMILAVDEVQRRSAQKIAAFPEKRLRGAVQSNERTASYDPAARPATS